MTNHTVDFIKALTSPDRQYGEVPFYWWNGDNLDKERLKSHLEMLSEKGLAGVQINYAHINKGGEENLSFGGHGKSIPGTPEQFSDEWWEFFAYAAKECERLGMSIGMGDYTIAWIGNGYFTDMIASTPGMNARNLSCEKKMLFSGDEEGFSEDTLAVITYSDLQCKKPIIIYEKGKGVVSNIKGICEAYIIKEHTTKNSIDPLNYDCGHMLVECYFKEFERRVPDVKPGTLNYFFQDELMFGADIKTLWSENLRKEIEKKYSYDVLGFLPHLFFNLGDITPKIRLDIADVKTEIMEEAYFKPVFEYHNSRGLIYGCDQSSRGKDPAEFSDYFRTVRWFTAPGNDTPGRAADLIKVKVNSSIAHLYGRPRVWLEGYHSSGWGTTLESITAPTSDNFIFGANLLNLHGLYYSTNAGFFEWAPPDFHFRMPYWDDEKAWLDKYKRLSQLLTTGKHRCDVAVYYPVSSCDYAENHESCVSETFSCAEYLFSNGVDFDFIDFQSIETSACKNGRLITKEEEYKALIFVNLDCIRYSALVKAEELLNSGGCVIFCGITPYASDRNGLNDDELFKKLRLILSHPNCILAPSKKDVLSFLNSRITRSFLPEITAPDQKTYVHTRIHGENTLFFVRYAEKNSVCRFEAEGIPYLLDSDTGEIIRLSGTVATEGFSFVKMPLESDRDTLILFTYDDIDFDKEINTCGYSEDETKEIIPLDGYWDFSLIPTLDNSFGDYYLPKSDILGPQARFFDIKAVSDKIFPIEKFDFFDIPYCTSRAIRKINISENLTDFCDFLAKAIPSGEENSFLYNGKTYTSEALQLHDRYYYHSYDYSPSLFEQGHHGLKGRIYDDNIIFSESCVIFTYVHSDKEQEAFLTAGDIKPVYTLLNGTPAKEGKITLRQGKNLLIAAFSYNKDEVPNYRNNSELKRTSLHITTEHAEKTDIPLSCSSFANPDYFKLSSSKEEKSLFCFRFTSAPALKSFRANIFGEIISAFCDNKEMSISFEGKGNFGGNRYCVFSETVSPDTSEILFFVKAFQGFEYASIIPEPVDLVCEKGRLSCGDLCLTGALKAYSGKSVYEKDIDLIKLYPYESFYLDLGDVGATANIEINGMQAAVLTYSPFTADITPFVVHGKNHIKITVSNTLCNHYSTIPSKYSNFPRDSKSGLIGPVRIRITEKTD